jgi:hypothetical protein
MVKLTSTGDTLPIKISLLTFYYFETYFKHSFEEELQKFYNIKQSVSLFYCFYCCHCFFAKKEQLSLNSFFSIYGLVDFTPYFNDVEKEIRLKLFLTTPNFLENNIGQSSKPLGFVDFLYLAKKLNLTLDELNEISADLLFALADKEYSKEDKVKRLDEAAMANLLCRGCAI